MIAGSRRGSVQTVQGFWLSILPHSRQTSIFSSAVCMAVGKRRHDLFALLDEEQRGAARRARAEPRQAGEQLDQTLDLGSGGGGGHESDQIGNR